MSVSKSCLNQLNHDRSAFFESTRSLSATERLSVIFLELRLLFSFVEERVSINRQSSIIISLVESHKSE